MAQPVPTRFGTALRFREPGYWDLNLLYVQRPGAPEDLVADAEAALSGLGHRMLVLDEPPEPRLVVAELGRRGWDVDRHVAMVAGPVPAGRAPRHPVAEVDPARIVGPRRRANAELGDDEATIATIELADAAVGEAGRERVFAVLAPDGTPVAWARLYADGATGQIEDVQTLAAHQGQGRAQAAVLGALAASQAAGHRMTFLWADEDDWPRGLYERLGFRVAGRRWRLRRSVA